MQGEQGKHMGRELLCVCMFVLQAECLLCSLIMLLWFDRRQPTNVWNRHGLVDQDREGGEWCAVVHGGGGGGCEVGDRRAQG